MGGRLTWTLCPPHTTLGTSFRTALKTLTVLAVSTILSNPFFERPCLLFWNLRYSRYRHYFQSSTGCRGRCLNVLLCFAGGTLIRQSFPSIWLNHDKGWKFRTKKKIKLKIDLIFGCPEYSCLSSFEALNSTADIPDRIPMFIIEITNDHQSIWDIEKWLSLTWYSQLKGKVQSCR